VANARQVGLAARSQKKTDRVDAETLARAARYDPELLRPIHHRGEQAQTALAMLRARKALLESRTRLVLSACGMVKAVGGRLPRCSADYFGSKALRVRMEAGAHMATT
jgi:transposase